MLEEEDRKEIIKLSEATHTSVVAFVLSLFIPLVGLILGLKAKNEIDRSKNTKSGSVFATAAIWIGAIGTLAWAAIIALMLVLAIGGHARGDGWGIGNRVEHRGFGNYQMMRTPDNGMMGGFGQGPGQGTATPDPSGATTNG